MNRIPKLRPLVCALSIITLGASASCADGDGPESGNLNASMEFGTLVLDLTYPDDAPAMEATYSVFYAPGADPAAEPPRWVDVTVDSLRLVVRGTGESVPLGPARFVLGARAGATLAASATRLAVELLPGATSIAGLTPLCGQDVALEAVVSVPECDCGTTVVAPIVLRCDEDRRASDRLAFVSEQVPYDMPCGSRQITRYSDGNVIGNSRESRYGYDSAGRLWFEDVYSDGHPIGRTVWTYDERGRVAREEDVLVSEERVAQLDSTVTSTWNDDGTLGRRVRRYAYHPYETITENYRYDDLDPDGWSTTIEWPAISSEVPDRQERWDESRDALVTHKGAVIRFARDFDRESWLGMPPVAAMVALRQTSIDRLTMTRTITWVKSRIHSDNLEDTALEAGSVTEWDYCQ